MELYVRPKLLRLQEVVKQMTLNNRPVDLVSTYEAKQRSICRDLSAKLVVL